MNIKGKNVLISKEFYYFGRKAAKLPARFKKPTKKGPGHRCNFPEKLHLMNIRRLILSEKSLFFIILRFRSQGLVRFSGNKINPVANRQLLRAGLFALTTQDAFA